MNSAPRPAPRFVPTLTEVVDPAGLGRLVPKTQTDDIQAIIDLVQRRMRPVLEQRLEDELNRLLRAAVVDQWTDLSARLQEDMEVLVRQTVARALGAQSLDKSSK